MAELPSGADAFDVAAWVTPGAGELTGVGVGVDVRVGIKPRNSGSNFLASSADENSMAIRTFGSLVLAGQLTTSMREPARVSACALSHFSTALNSFGGPTSFTTGSNRSLSAGERIN